MNSPKKPMMLLLAGTAGFSAANDWLERSVDTSLPVLSFEEYRLGAYTAAAKKYASLVNAPELLAEWEHSFDKVISAAAEYEQVKQYPPNIIASITDQANAVASILAVLYVLPAADRRVVLVTCSSIARDLSRNLAVLLGEEA